MAKPRTLTDAVGLLRRCRLLDDPAVEGVAARADAGDLAGLTADALFDRLAADGTLTSFQSRQLAAGRWRGLVLRQYHLLDRLGSGGSGRVFLGEHVGLGRKVAVKVLTLDAADDPTARGRLVREARAAAALDHPYIVRVFDLDADANPPYLVMEYVDGVSLQAAVAVSGTFRAEAAALVGRQVALGLQHAWERGLVHRDVKPANLLIDRAGRMRILDLGIVRGDFDDGLTAGDGRREILGTVDYLAPEQAVDSSAVDCRADVYGLGATLYFLLAGHPPFADVPPAARLRRKLEADPEPIRRLRPDVPAALSDVIAAMTARHPRHRPRTPAAAARALAPFAVPIDGFPDDLFAAARTHRTGAGTGTAPAIAAVTPPSGVANRSSVLPGLPDIPPPAPTVRFAVMTPRVSPPVPRPKPRRARREAVVVWGTFAVVVAALTLLAWAVGR